MTVATLQRLFSRSDLPGSGRATRVKHFIGDYGLAVVFVACIAGLGLSTDSFMTRSNLINVLRQSSIIGLIAIGMTFVMITGGIDLSVGSVAGLAGVIAASLAASSSGAFVFPILAGVGVGLAIGLINATLVVRGGILAFLATLAVMAATRGVALVYTNGQPIYDLSAAFRWIGAGNVAGIPVPIILFLAIALFADHTLTRTRFGRHVYAVGGNPDSARIVGIPVGSVLATVYLIAAILAAFAGVVLTARVDGADPLAGTGYELDAIAAVVIGGTSLFGGVGTIRGTILGVLLLGVVQNGLNLLNVSSYYQNTVQGLILIVAVLLNRWKSD